MALSTGESQQYSIVMVCQYLLFLSRILEDCGLPMSTGIPLCSDNQYAIDWAVGERCPYGRAKHIDVKIHIIPDFVKRGIIKVKYVPSEDSDANILTKPLSPALTNPIMERVCLIQELEEKLRLDMCSLAGSQLDITVHRLDRKFRLMIGCF